MVTTSGLVLASAHVYPVKGLRGFDVDQATVEPWGLAGDRRFMVVDRDGRLLTQRAHPVLTQATAGYDPDGALRIRPAAATGLPELRVPAGFGGPLVDVRVWRSTVAATVAPDDVNAWFGKLVGADVRLVYLDDPRRRPVNPEYGGPSDRVSFADGYPLLVTTLASLGRLNEIVVEGGDESGPLPMNRFRPSVVVAGGAAWDEDGWRRVRIGGQEFRVAKPCARCVVTRIDQDTGRRSRGPLRALARHHRVGGKLVFGQSLIPDTTGPLHVGDPVTILE